MDINEEVFHKILKRTLHNEINGNEIDPVTLLYDIYAILMDYESTLKKIRYRTYQNKPRRRPITL